MVPSDPNLVSLRSRCLDMVSDAWWHKLRSLEPVCVWKNPHWSWVTRTIRWVQPGPANSSIFARSQHIESWPGADSQTYADVDLGRTGDGTAWCSKHCLRHSEGWRILLMPFVIVLCGSRGYQFPKSEHLDLVFQVCLIPKLLPWQPVHINTYMHNIHLWM